MGSMTGLLVAVVLVEGMYLHVEEMLFRYILVLVVFIQETRVQR